MLVRTALAYFGGNQSRLAAALGIKRPSVNDWVRRDRESGGKTLVPKARAYQLSVITAGALKFEWSAYVKIPQSAKSVKEIRHKGRAA